jgi:hypothetical protein
MMRRRSTRGSALLGVLLLAFLTACGGSGSSGAADRPGITASPTRERPTATREPDTPGGSSEAGPTRGPTRGPTSEPAPEPTSAPATREPPRSSAPVSSSTESTAPSGSTTGEESGSNDAWWWLVLVVLVAGGLVAWFLMRRARSRRAWTARLTAAEGEVGWFARDLIPQLRGSGSLAGVAGGWHVASARVTSLDDQLSQLVSTAPGEGERSRATALRGAVRTARDRVVAVVSAGEGSQWSLDLDDAQAPLLGVLVPAGTTGPAAPGAGTG